MIVYRFPKMLTRLSAFKKIDLFFNIQTSMLVMTKITKNRCDACFICYKKVTEKKSCSFIIKVNLIF